MIQRIARSTVAAWVALLGAVLLAVGSGAMVDDLRTLFGPRTDGILAAARVLAALVAAITGPLLAHKEPPV